MRTFFETWHQDVAVLNGFEVRSITHERCRKILMTGSADGLDDWPTVLAAHGSSDLLLPHLVIAGPAFSNRYTSRVVRVGTAGQLPELLDGSALERSLQGVALPSQELEALQDAYLADRLSTVSAAAGRGREARLLDQYLATLDQLSALSTYADQLDLSPEDGGCSRDLTNDAKAILDTFELGVSRCGMVQHNGWCDSSWDTHEGNDFQSVHYEELFAYLVDILDELSSRTGPDGASLMDTTTVVVMSEMGRHPQLNAYGGKDHWTFTSAMLLGAGVRGGQVLGGLDENATGLPFDLATGELHDDGVVPLASNLGATLLALGDVDPADYVLDEPIGALMS
ncbi:MAG: DUF1501 domain-containing protein [Proteobacteria bacterium]|nr:DUF1501 domain-containing protein [Pseudomonadota bacterium]